MTHEVDERVPRYLGRVLDDDGHPAGTCFHVAQDVLVTACHVLEAIGGPAEGSRIRVDPLGGGEVLGAVVARVDPLRDLAVLTCDACPLTVAGALTETDRMPRSAKVTVTGHAALDDPGHAYRFLDASGEWAGGTTRDDVRLGRMRSKDAARGMSGAPVICDGNGAVAGVVSGRYNSADGWQEDTVWVARSEDVAALLNGIAQIAFTSPVRGDAASAPGAPATSEVDEWAEGLARGVRALWQQEEDHRRVHDPVALPVSWRPAVDGLADHWANIRRVQAGAAARPLALAGRIEQLAEIYRSVPSRRLVILGQAGAGKTVLASRLALDLLAARRPGEPVPVIVGASSWNPAATPLNVWLAGQLGRDHPGLAVRTGRGGPTRADELIAAGRVLPILDGFDEIDAGSHQAALRQLNRTPDAPVVITSRVAEYTAAVRDADVLTAAAVIELDDLTLEDLAAYLPRTVAGPRKQMWDQVLKRMRTEPHAQGPAMLREVLASPLMVFLARTAYSDTPGHDPAHLLDTRRFPAAQALRDHLLAAFLPAVYEAGEPGRPCRWPADRVHRHLAYLAGHLHKAGSRDLAWWQLRDTIPRPRRIMVFALVDGLVAALGIGLFALVDELATAPAGRLATALEAGLVIALVIGLVTMLASGLTMALTARLTRARPGGRRGFSLGKVTIALTVGLTVAVVTGLVAALAFAVALAAGRPNADASGPAGPAPVGLATTIGFLAAVVFGLVAALAVGLVGLRGAGPQPTRTRLQVRGRVRFIVGRFAAGLAAGLTISAVAGLATVAAGYSVLGFATGFGLVVVIVAGIAAAVMFGLEAPVQADDVAGAAESLARDRSNAIRKVLTAGLIAGLALGLGDGFASGPISGLEFGLPAAVVVGFVSVRATSAWIYWLVLVRGWLPLTGRLPWRVQEFLTDAYQRGVLRQTGAVYQFRHARLEDHLRLFAPRQE